MTNAGAFEYWGIGKTAIWRRVKHLIGLGNTRRPLVRSYTIPNTWDTLEPLPHYTIDHLGHPWDILEPLPQYTIGPLGLSQTPYELDIERGIVDNTWGKQTLADIMLI